MSENVGLHATLTMDAGNFSATLSQARDKLAQFAVEERKIKNEINKAESALKEQATKFGKDSEEAKKASQALEKLYRENLELQSGIKQVTDSINKQTAAFAQNAKQGNSTAEQLKKGFTVLKGLAVGYAGKTLYDALIGSNADFEQKLTSFDVLLGSADKAQKMMDDLTKFAADTPLQLPDVSKATQLLLSYGVAQEDVMTRLGQLGDLAQGNAEKLDRVSLAYGQMLAKGKVTGEELRQMTEAGVPLVQSLADVIGITTAELTKMMEKGSVGIPELNKAIEAMTSEGGKFYNMMEKQAETMSGMLSTIGDNINMFAREVGEESFEYLKDEISVLLDTIRQMEESGELQEIASEIGEGVANAVTFIGNFIQILWEMHDVLIVGAGAIVGYKVAVEGLAIVQGVVTWFQTWITTLNSLKTAKTLGISLSTLYKAAMLGEQVAISACSKAGLTDITVKGTQVTATNAATGATLSFNTALMANPIGLVVSAIGLLVGALVTYSMTADDATDSTSELIKESQELRKAIQENSDEFEKSCAKVKEEEETINDLISTMERLDSQTELTDAEKQKLRDTAAQLENIISGLNIEIDSETGHLQTQIGVVRNLANEYINLAYAKAASRKIEEIADKQLDLEVENIKLRKERDSVYDIWDENGQWTPKKNRTGIATEGALAWNELNDIQGEIDSNIAAKKDLDKEIDYIYQWASSKGITKEDIHGSSKNFTDTGDGGGGYSGGSGSGNSSSSKKTPEYKEYTFSRPSEGAVTSGYGDRTSPITGQYESHDGIDIGAYNNETVKASAPGKVVYAGWVNGYGNYVEIDHGNGISTFYAHMDSIDVSVGQTVGKGIRLGGAGSTGWSTGTHIHFGAKKNGQSINPDDLVAGKYGTVWSTVEGDTKTQDALDRERERQRKEKVSAYKQNNESIISTFQKNQKQALAYGYITEKEYIDGLKKQSEAYKKWADEVLELDYFTWDEKEELIRDYYDKASDYQLQYYEDSKAYAKNELDYSIELSSKWIEEQKRFNSWSNGDTEAKAWGRVLERVRKYYNEDFYNPNQQREYLDMVSEIEGKMRDAIISDTKKTIEEVSELKREAYQKEMDSEIEQIEKQHDIREKALNDELNAIRKKTDARIDYLNKLKQEREEKKEDEDDALKLERLQTRLEYEMDEGNRASIIREINKLNEEIDDKEFNRWIESEKEKAETSEKIESEKINRLIETEENNRKRSIDRITDYYTSKMLNANLVVESLKYIPGMTQYQQSMGILDKYSINSSGLPTDTLKKMQGVFDTVKVNGEDIPIETMLQIQSISDAFGITGSNIPMKDLGKWIGYTLTESGLEPGSTVVNHYSNNNSTTNITNEIKLEELTPSKWNKTTKAIYDDYVRSGYTS